MSIRERYFAAMRRQADCYVPFDFVLCPKLLEEFRQRAGTTEYWDYYQFPARDVSADYTGATDKFNEYYPDRTNLRIDPDWGVARKKGSLAHFTKMQHPMQAFQRLAEFEAFPFPDPDRDYDWRRCAEKIQNLKDKDRVAACGGEMGMFEMAWYLRGLEPFLVDLGLQAETADFLLERITEIQCLLARNYALAGCDVLKVGDDVATQQTMMIKPITWRKHLKPRMARVIQSAKSERPEVLVYYHSDGNLQAIIPDLIEIGVEILNPVQPECMDPEEIKRQYGERLSFWGTIGTQTTMPFGSPAEVLDMCLRRIREVGRSGGLGLAPTHVLEPDVPWENIEAFIETVCDFNCKGYL